MEKLKQYDYYYHTVGEPIVSDYDYDILKEKLLKEYPNDPYFKKVGFEISDCIKLPYYMGSLDKFKDDNIQAILRWKKKYNGNYLISDKLDGISALIDYKNDTINIYSYCYQC
jgi:NAD-dependent DNA ligase